MKNLIVILAAAAMILSCNSKPKMSDAEIEAEAEREVQELMDSIQNLPAQETINTWEYEASTDEMTSETQKFASIRSNNEVQLEFPYAGGTSCTIFLRKTGKQDEAFIVVSDGQIDTDINNPTIKVRFDNNPPVLFSVTESSDNSSTVRFISSTAKFINAIKASKEAKVEITFYSNGTHVYKFNTENLKW